jgi:hypothetical protein
MSTSIQPAAVGARTPTPEAVRAARLQFAASMDVAIDAIRAAELALDVMEPSMVDDPDAIDAAAGIRHRLGGAATSLRVAARRAAAAELPL